MGTPLPASTLELARTGDPGAWEDLVSAWSPAILQWCRRLGGPRVDPLDAAQDVLTIAFTRIHQVYCPEVFPAWLFGITRRVLARHRRNAWLRRWTDMFPGPGPRVEAAQLRTDLVVDVQRILERLSTSHREVPVLCDVEERTSAEVAVLLGIPHATVRSRLAVARARFRDEARGLALFRNLAGEGP